MQEISRIAATSFFITTILALSAPTWASVPVGTPKMAVFRPGDEMAPVLATFDCSSAIPVSLSPNTTQTLTGDTTAAPSLISSYACQPWNESGPEVIYEITTTETLLLHAVLSSPGIDLDIFLLSDCDTDSCVAGHIAEFMAVIPAGTWYLVVDGHLGAAGPYELTIAGLETGLPQAACDEAEDVTTIGEVLLSGNIFEQPNHVTMASCASFLEWGGERWYRMTVPARTEATISLIDLFFDGALWIFEQCGDQATCLGFADAYGINQPESIIYSNLTASPETILVGVDSFREVSAAAGDTEFDGAFDLSITSIVPAERTSVGGLKSLFR